MEKYNLSIKNLFVAILAGSFSLLLFRNDNSSNSYVYFCGSLFFALYFSNIIKVKAISIIIKLGFVAFSLYLLFTGVDSVGLKFLGVLILAVGAYCNETRTPIKQNA